MLIYDVILDVGTTGCQQTVSLYQGDDRSKMLRVTLLQDGKAYAVPPDLNVRLYAVKPDEDEISAKCAVRGGSVYCLPAANMTDVQGTVRCQLQIRDHSGAVLFTPEFAVQVVGTVPVPELPEGASEDVPYNTEVLSELSASEDGQTLLFRGEPVGTVRVVTELPQSAGENAIVYLIGEGLFRYTNDLWMQLTDDETVAAVALLQEDSHTHANAQTIGKLNESFDELWFDGRRVGIETVSYLPEPAAPGKIVYYAGGLYYNKGTYQIPTWQILTIPVGDVLGLTAAKHTHSNKEELDALSASDGNLLYNGKEVGIKVNYNGQFPSASAYIGKILYCAYYSSAGFYYSDGTAWIRLTNNSDPSAVSQLLAVKHAHENKPTLDKFGESGGKPTYDGAVIGGVQTAATPSALPANVSDGTLAVALADDASGTVVYPQQVADEEVSVDIAEKEIKIGNPTFNGTAIDAAIAAQTIDITGNVEIVTGVSSDGYIFFSVLPVVSDEDTNEYTAAGITIEDALVVPNFTKKYAIQATFAGIEIIKPDKIVPVDAEHVKVPGLAVYLFENLYSVEMPTGTADMVAGWNIALVTIDTATYSQITDIEVVSGANPNDYFNLTNHDENTFTIEGVGASELFANVIAGKEVKQKGVYVRLSNDWKRLTME